METISERIADLYDEYKATNISSIPDKLFISRDVEAKLVEELNKTIGIESSKKRV